MNVVDFRVTVLEAADVTPNLLGKELERAGVWVDKEVARHPRRDTSGQYEEFRRLGSCLLWRSLGHYSERGVAGLQAIWRAIHPPPP